MRITNQMMASNVLNNLTGSLNQLNKLQQQLSSGYKISEPSDDPAVASQVLQINAAMAQHDQYDNNINTAINWLDTTDSALGDAGSILQTAKTLAIQGANATNSQTSLQAIATEVNQLINNMVQVGNTEIAGRYIFSGTKTTAAPFSGDSNSGVTYSGNGNELGWEVGQGVTMSVSLTGSEVFGSSSGSAADGTGSSIFDHLIKLKNDLNDAASSDPTTAKNAQDALNGSDLSNLGNDINQILNERAVVGAKGNRMTMAQGRSTTEKEDMTQMKSSIYDVDIAQAMVSYSETTTTYQAALATSAKMLQPTLMDYLK